MTRRLHFPGRRALVVHALVAMLIAALLMTLVHLSTRQASASSSLGSVIPRSEVIARAQNWYGRSLTYCCNDGSRPASKFVTDVDGAHKYGPDCSGMISMAWHVDPGSSGGYNTSTLPDISTQITDRTHIKQGDILLDVYGSEHHVILFDQWQPDHVHFSYYSFGSTPMRHYDGGSGSTEGPFGSFTSGAKLASFDQSHYVAYQYNKIMDDPHPGQLADVNSDGRPDIVARDANGALWVYPHAATTSIMIGTWQPRIQVGSGWNIYTWFALADVNGDGYTDIVARDYSGKLFVYQHAVTTNIFIGMWAPAVQVGAGWNVYTSIVLGHVSDGPYPDILARDASGRLVAYLHNATTAIMIGTWAAGVQIGSGWDEYAQIALDNVGKNNSRTTGDGPELIGLDYTGHLYAYPNNDFGALNTSTFGSRILVGSGWNIYKTFLTGDVNGDGYTDLLGLDIYGGFYAYPNNHVSTIGSGMWGSRIQVGSGWNIYTQVD